MEYTSTSKIAIWCLQWHNKQLEYNIMQNKILKCLIAFFPPLHMSTNISVGRALVELSLKSMFLGICGG